MSIPPLVCSTPPPPEQCEDDKDPDDFDISYSLSQEGDDENNDYDYANFTSYNHYQTASDNKPPEVTEQEMVTSTDGEIHREIFIWDENSKVKEQSDASHDVIQTNDINENNLKCEEDINLEDLNLSVDEEIVTSIVDNSDANEKSDPTAGSLKDLNIQCNSNKSTQDDYTLNVSTSVNIIDHTVDFKESQVDIDNEIILENSSDIQTTHHNVPYEGEFNHVKEKDDIPSVIKETLDTTDDFPEEFQKSIKSLEFESNDDDFGQFDDFQFVSTKSNVTSVVDTSNPWENTETNATEFGNFTANFEENKFHIPVSNDQMESPVKDQEHNLDEDDDFGDFDDFKSSTVRTDLSEVQEDSCPDLPVLNLQSTDNEHHIMESITKVLTSVFIEEISEPDTEFEGKLETLLGETWGHLMETDERQPYIVNWNNSLGQKTLLKALCIDSRNILFGPKWTSHMPKYAANLSVAPLQPQKKTSAPSYVSQNELVADKAPSKPTTWSDPFTSDGQEFTYAEALLLDLEHLMATLDQMAHNHSTLKISELLSHACNADNENPAITTRPTDLDVFEAAVPTKSDKIYSSTLSVQPIRQISLPDTHIFTPTDSEIPRSKTIHYDRSPPVLLPQPVIVDQNLPDNLSSQNINSVTPSAEDDNEYWEFQDFKGPSDASSLPGSVSQLEIKVNKNIETTTTVDTLPKQSIAYQSQLLQPIKVEPSMPTLNWPDPGEVKVAYDDFSDFVSITSQAPEVVPPSESQTIRPDTFNDFSQKTAEVLEVEANKTEKEDYEDDFNTFQSALPSKSASASASNQMPLGGFADFDYTSPKINSVKSDTISFASMPKSDETLTEKVGYTTNTSELTSSKSLSPDTQIHPNLLQPTPAGFSAINTQNQRTTGQILQPLSLESYSQINWPSPGIDLQDLSRFNPVETLQSLKSDLSVGGLSKVASPVHSHKITAVNQASDDDVWGEFVSSKPKQQQSVTKKPSVFAEDDEWTDFISSPSVKPQNGLNTISLNVHTNSNIQKSAQNKFAMKTNQMPVDIPTLNYITPKSSAHKSYNDKHFQNL